MTDGQGRSGAGQRVRGNRGKLILLGGGVTLFAAVALASFVGQKSDGHGSTATTATPESTAIGLPLAEEATSIFDRGGPDGGELLGRLNVGSRRDGDIRAELFIDNQVEPRLVRMCQAGWLPAPPSGQDCVQHIHTVGYRVTTTLNWAETERARDLLRTAVEAGLQAGCDCHDGAIVTIEPSSGEVIVYVPNLAEDGIQAPAVRPDIDQLTEVNTPGSAFMPVTFLAWFDRLGKAPLSTLWDTSPLQLPGGGSIANPRANGGTEGLISARAALAAMQDVPAFRAADEVGIAAVLDMAARLGITTLATNFDPTWTNHADATYGSSLGMAGVNIRAIDVAYAHATIVNMGVMVGTPGLATTLDVGNLKGTSTARDQDYDQAIRQHVLFQRGDVRLPGTRELDPIVVLEVSDRDGNVLFSQGPAERRQVVDAGSVWLLHTIMSDCTARFVIWGCGSSNRDLSLDFALADGRLVPAGVQFGRTASPSDPALSLEVWMTGYSRHAATVVWVGNWNNAPVHDRAYAASNTAVRLWKTWMGSYHDTLQARGELAALGFDELQPGNVAFGPFRTTATDRGQGATGSGNYAALCEQVADGWFRIDVQYASECESGLRALPALLPEAAISLARMLGIPVALPGPGGD